MKIPSVHEAEKILTEAEMMNPGEWVSHSRVAARCAKTIAEHCDGLDADAAYIFALLHDVGRRIGVCGVRHVYEGYMFMLERGYDDIARICLTHTFPFPDVWKISGRDDLSLAELEYLQAELNKIKYNDYDRLIQLCDAIAYNDGPCTVEKRLIDVAIRRGINDYTVEKWKAFLNLRDYFNKKVGGSIYALFDNLIL